MMKENCTCVEKIYKVELFGAGGHGSRPDLSRNPILCYAAFVSALRGIPVSAEYRILSAESGNGANIIPETAEICLSVLEESAFEGEFRAILDKVLTSVCKIYHCDYKISI